MTDFAALESPLYDEPRFYCEPTDRDPTSELARVKRFRSAIREALPGVVVTATPNAAKRGQKALNQAKAEGALWGFPDITVIYRGKIAFLEWKNGKRQPEQHQIDAMNSILDQGFPVALVRTTEGAFSVLRQAGFPIDG